MYRKFVIILLRHLIYSYPPNTSSKALELEKTGKELGKTCVSEDGFLAAFVTYCASTHLSGAKQGIGTMV